MNSAAVKRSSRLLALALLPALLAPGVVGSLLGTASAAPVISAQSIIVNPVPTELRVRVWTDRGGNATYAPGDRIRLYTSVNRDAYVYLFNVDPRGGVDLILPNRSGGGGNLLRANTTRAFPDAGDPFTFDVAGPRGPNKVLALASRTPLDLGGVASFGSSGGAFATVNVRGQDRLARALSAAVGPVERAGWVTSTATYNVVARTGTPVPARPVPVRPAPLPAAPDWRTSLERQSSVGDVYAEYAARLRAEGYRQVNLRRSGGGRHLRGEFRRDGKRATLEVGQKGNRFEVRLSRR